MSDLSSALLIIMMFLSVLALLGIAIGLFLACITIVETTAITRRALRKTSRKSESVHVNIEALIGKWITNPIDQIDKVRDWLISTTTETTSSRKTK